MTNNTNKTQADELYSQFKEEIDTVTIDDRNDMYIEEIYELVKLSEYDLARALYTAYSLGCARSAAATALR